MEHLFLEHPEECLVFFKRNIKISLVTGGGLISAQVSALIKSRKSWEAKNIKDKLLWFWVVLRILAYFLQIPIRYKLAQMVWQAHRQNGRARQGLQLLEMLRTWEWTVVQHISRALLIWLSITIISTWWFKDVFEDQVHRKSVSRYCWISVLLLCTQTAISIRWLKRVLNEGWVDNTEISLSEFRNCSDQFRSLAELKWRLYSRSSPFDQIPLTAKLQALEKDRIKNVQIYFPSDCAICKSGFSISSPSAPVHESTPVPQDGKLIAPAHNGESAPLQSEQSRPITLLPCGHIFHVECIEAWITLRHSKCPYCNMSTLSGRVWLSLKEEYVDQD